MRKYHVLPIPQSDLVQQSLKDPYVFDFLTLHKEYLEKDLEDGLVKHIQKFLIELGKGFAFVGQQYPFKAGEHDLYFKSLDERLLIPKTCFSIEPGIYLPKEFGVRLGYDIYINDDHTIEVTGGVEDKLVSLF